MIIEGQVLLGFLRSWRNCAPLGNDFLTLGIDIQYKSIKRETVQFVGLEGHYFVNVFTWAAAFFNARGNQIHVILFNFGKNKTGMFAVMDFEEKYL